VEKAETLRNPPQGAISEEIDWRTQDGENKYTMEIVTILAWLIAIIALVVLLVAIMGKNQKHRAVKGAASGIVLVLAVLFVTGVASFGVQTAGLSGFGGGDGSTGDCGTPKPIEDFKVKLIEDLSGSYTGIYGDLKVYQADANPNAANTNPIADVYIDAGKGSYTDQDLKTCTDYRVIFYDNASTQVWYSEDFEKMQFVVAPTTDNVVDYTFTNDGSNGIDKPIVKMATLDDIFDETSTSNNQFNGQTNTSLTSGTNEIGCAADCATADESIYYNETSGNGEFYIKPTFSASGANKRLR